MPNSIKFVFFPASRHQVPLLGPGRDRLLFEWQVVVRRRTHEAVQDSNADTSRQNARRHGQAQRIPNSVKLTIKSQKPLKTASLIHTVHYGILQLSGIYWFLQSSQFNCAAFSDTILHYKHKTESGFYGF